MGSSGPTVADASCSNSQPASTTVEGSTRDSPSNSIGLLENSGDLDAGPNFELAEDVSQMRFNGLGAEKQGLRDLGIRSTIDDELGNLFFACSQRADPDRIAAATPRTPMNATAKEAQLVVCRVAVAARPAVMERACGELEFRDCLLAFTCLRQRTPGQGM